LGKERREKVANTKVVYWAIYMCEDCETLGWWWLLLLLRGWFVLFETAGSLSLFHLWQERKSKRNSGSGRETVRTNA